MAGLTTQIALRSTLGASIFFIAKFLRFILFLSFIILLEQNTKTIAGYSIWQMVLFFATFNLVDVIPQFLFREVYRFRDYIVQGSFDFILTKPIPPLFRSLLGGSDVLDIPMVFASVGLSILAISKISVTLEGILLYLGLVANGLIIAFAFHVFTLSLGILTTEIDHTILLYRNLTEMGRIPVDIYFEPIRSIITFAIPIGIMMTFPPKALMALLSSDLIIISFMVSLVFLASSLYFWKFAVKRYQSASS